ncbi:MAG: LON peptidase substrate-binding domain-containing protein [Cyclobacteriaceae bacterium]|nr:LON peptidase substrate-binding domain-containing protein [Cyclobacteriaceae bacterium]
MSYTSTIPMFPLSILPLPGELVPLHIFEPRYKQLLEDAANADFHFGIYFNNTINEGKIGSLMKLESVIKRYPGGESDIIVKCLDNFYLHTLYRTYKTKLYPGGEVTFWDTNQHQLPGVKLSEQFREYLQKRKITRHQGFFNVFAIAQELSLDLPERYQLLVEEDPGREKLLLAKIRLQLHVLQREEISRDSYHLN